VSEVGESDFRLNHPELGEVAARVRVLRSERRPERVDLGESEAVCLYVELARHRQECFATKEITREINLPLRCARQVGKIERRYPEQGTRTLGVRGGKVRGVDPEKTVLLKKPRECCRRAVRHPPPPPLHPGP